MPLSVEPLEAEHAARIRQKAVDWYETTEVIIINPDGSDAYIEPADHGAWVAALVWVSAEDGIV